MNRMTTTEVGAQAGVTGSSLRDRVSPEEWQTRVDLAACYRLMAEYGMTDMIYNHITARVPGTDDEILINAYGLMYEEITASSLVKINVAGDILLQPDHGFGINPAGYVIHSAVHSARHDVGCVIHTHTRAGMAVSAMECGLLPLTQTSMRFHGYTSYHDYEGPALNMEERERLVKDLGNTDAMVLRNHGLLVCGRTIPEAFSRIYFIENACKIQVDTMAAQGGIHLPSEEVAQRTAATMQPDFTQTNNKHNSGAFDGLLEWRALRRMLDRRNPGYDA